ncbi:MAG: DUF401 family protein [Spirochaetia bacterium]|nr:DUF401 family protein [Spirochaetia bacterium]
MLWGIPVIIIIFISLGIILLADRLIKNLALSVMAGALFLAVFSGRSLKAIISLTYHSIFNTDTAMLLVLIYAMLAMSNQIKTNRIMENLTMGLQTRISGKLLLSSVPALVGLIPMPGGALFSAPLVDACDTDHILDQDSKSRINFWFRHIWELWFPLYAGILMTMQITGLNIKQIFCANFSMTIFMILGGYIFILKGLPIKSKHLSSPKKLPVLRYMTPIITIVAGTSVLNIIFPWGQRFSKYTSLVLSILLAIIICQLWKPIGKNSWKKILLLKNSWQMLLVIIAITIYGSFLKTPLENNIYIMDIMRSELNGIGIPSVLLFAILPLISGLATGIQLGFVGTSFPIIFSLLGPNPAMKNVYIMLILGYGFGHIGQMLSPVHVCNIVTHKYFNTSLLKNTIFLLKPCAILALGSILTAAFVAIFI